MPFVIIIKYNKRETVLHICPFLASYLHGQIQNGSFTALFAITGAWARWQAGMHGPPQTTSYAKKQVSIFAYDGNMEYICPATAETSCKLFG